MGRLPLALTLLAALAPSGRGVGFRPTLGTYTPRSEPAEEDDNATAFNASSVDCQATPWMCEAPFDCISENVGSMTKLKRRVATKDGRPNPKSWCADSRFWNSTVKECLVDGQPKKAAASRLSLQLYRGADDEDAKYCFIGQLCAISEIDENTTAEQAEAVCSKQYGDKWKSTGLQAFYTGLTTNEHNFSNDFLETSIYEARKRASAKSRIACAQGSFHCDVVYCKEYYCGNRAYRALYAKHITWEVQATPSTAEASPDNATETPA